MKVDQERHDLVACALNLHGIVVNGADTSVRKRAVLEVALPAQRTTLDDSEDQEAQGYAQRCQACWLETLRDVARRYDGSVCMCASFAKFGRFQEFTMEVSTGENGTQRRVACGVTWHVEVRT